VTQPQSFRDRFLCWHFETTFSPADRIDTRRAAFIAITIGTLSGVMAWKLIGRPGYSSDFFHYWSATRTLLEGGDPYRVIPQGLRNPGNDVALYPMPAYLLLVPFAPFPLSIAGGLFMGLSAGLAAWGIARTGIARLPVFLSASFFLALSLGQWTPLLVAAALIPALAPVIVAKPTLGAAVWAARPSLRTLIIAALIVLLSLVIMPAWPREWLTNISGREEKFVPLLRPGGFLLVLALLAWKRPEGRLLIVMSVVPHNLLFYDQLLLWLIPRTLRQSLSLSICSLLLFLIWRWRLEPGDLEVQLAAPYAYALYGVALGILLWNWWRDRLTARARGELAPAGGAGAVVAPDDAVHGGAPS